MSGVQICSRLLDDSSAVAAPVHIGLVTQPTVPPFICVSHVYEGQEVVLRGAAPKFETRVSVSIFTADAIECDRLAEAVKNTLGYVVHQRVGSGTTAFRDVSILKTGGDIFDYNDERTAYRRVIDFMVRWQR